MMKKEVAGKYDNFEMKLGNHKPSRTVGIRDLQVSNLKGSRTGFSLKLPRFPAYPN